MMNNRKRPASASSASKTGKKIKVGVRIKEDPGFAKSSSNGVAAAAAAAAAPAGALTKADIRDRFIQLFSEPKYKSGISNKALKEKFNDEKEYLLLVEVINELLRESRLHMSRAGVENELFYTLVAADVAQKYQGLDVSARMVLQVIEKAANNGIWTKEIRMQTNIQQQALNKIFKLLEQRRLIKPVKSVTAKAKKLYMLYELTPSKELTGGVWYSGLEFDYEFFSELRLFVVHCVRRLNGGQGITLAEIKNKMLQANVSRVQLSLDEVKQLVQTLVYDYLVEDGAVSDNGETQYVPARRVLTMCDFKWWDAQSPDFHFRTIKFEDGVTLKAHEPHHHTA
jgi:DNA-directed RNA polymerase III subunit RPC6